MHKSRPLLLVATLTTLNVLNADLEDGWVTACHSIDLIMNGLFGGIRIFQI
jgi:hypothetical protein